jgi:hypothetical protein
MKYTGIFILGFVACIGAIGTLAESHHVRVTWTKRMREVSVDGRTIVAVYPASRAIANEKE